MINYTSFFITENDLKMIEKVYHYVKNKKDFPNYEKQSLFRFKKDIKETIEEYYVNNPRVIDNSK